MYVARDLMTTPVITVAPHATLAQATELLLKHGISGMPVIDLAGRIVGMFSELDESKPIGELLSIVCGASILDEGGHSIGNISGFAKARKDLLARADHRVKDYMTTDVIVVKEDEPATRVIDLFISHRVHRLPVMRGHELVGVIGVRDVVTFVREIESKLGVTSR
jgi:CBS domain-containing protein